MALSDGWDEFVQAAKRNGSPEAQHPILKQAYYAGAKEMQEIVYDCWDDRVFDAMHAAADDIYEFHETPIVLYEP